MKVGCEVENTFADSISKIGELKNKYFKVTRRDVRILRTSGAPKTKLNPFESVFFLLGKFLLNLKTKSLSNHKKSNFSEI